MDRLLSLWLKGYEVVFDDGQFRLLLGGDLDFELCFFKQPLQLPDAG